MAARRALSAVDRFVVHSRWECQVLSDWLKVPPERFQFVPLQRAPITLTETEETEHPFLLALGTAHRDYRTLFEAIEKLQLPTVVVAGHHALKGLHPPANVTIRSGPTPDECHRLAQQARATIVPLDPTPTAAGQITVIESMRMGRPIVATQCPGTVDYLRHDETGLLVSPTTP